MANDRNIWIFGKWTKPMLKDKSLITESYIKYMLNKTIRMFEYENLPETIPHRELELIIQMCRFGIVTKKDGKLFIFYGGLGGQPNEYYQPTQAIVSNPYLKFSDVLNLDDYIKPDSKIDAVVMWNDSAHIGLYPMFRKNAELLTECDVTLKYALVNLRFMNVLTADDDNRKESIKKMFEDVEDGTGYGIIVSDTLINEKDITSIEMGGHKNNSPLKDIVETKQYVLGTWYNELGLNASFNMKREAISQAETGMNEDTLLPLIDDMLQTRKLAVEQINKKFGTNISVKLSSSWKKVRDEIVLDHDLMKAKADAEEEKAEEPQQEENSPSEEKEDDKQD